MTAPRASQLEAMSGLTQHGKSWVKAIVSEAISLIPKDRSEKQECSKCALVQSLEERVQYLEKRYKEDDKFALTKAKLLMFIEEHGVK